MLVLNGESSSWLSDVWRQHSQEWLCHKDLRRANAAGLWSCPTPPCRPSSPTSLYKSPHRCPPVDRLLPPPSRQNNPAQPPRVVFLFQVTQAGKNRTTSCLPFVMLKCPLFQPQRRSAITLPQRFERACRDGRLAPSPPGLESRRPWSRPGSPRPPLRRLRLRSPRLSRRLQSRR